MRSVVEMSFRCSQRPAGNSQAELREAWRNTGHRAAPSAAHVLGVRAEQAYRRSDALEKRRRLMEAWAAYCTAKPTEKVVHFRQRRRAATPDSGL